MRAPPVQWAESPDGKIAYQLVGEGPIDLAVVPGTHWNVDVAWENPQVERWLRRLASFSRLILWNFLGSGPSDPVQQGVKPTLEEWVSDLRWVLDSAGSETAAIMNMQSAAPLCVLFAATFPERTRALVLLDCYATSRRYDDCPWGLPPEAMDRFVEGFIGAWGTGESLRLLAPELVDDDDYRAWFARLERASLSQARMAATSRMAADADVRGILRAIKAPTLVISHTRSPLVRLGHGRYLAEHIPNARYVEREGFWGLPWVRDVDWTLGEVESFLTGTRGVPELDDRVLATVLFTDIVGSTERAAELGDRRWRELSTSTTPWCDARSTAIGEGQ